MGLRIFSKFIENLSLCKKPFPITACIKYDINIGNTGHVSQVTSTVPVLLIYKQSKQCPVVLNQAATLPRMAEDTVQFVYTIHKYSPCATDIRTI